MNDIHSTDFTLCQEAVGAEQTTCSPGVLVVDDEEAVRTMLGKRLQKLGCKVWLAKDGMEAIDIFRRQHPHIDLALLDVRMPDLDGPQTLEQLQAIKPEVPFYFMSADPGRYSDEELLERGASGILGKPFRFQEIEQLVEQVAAAPCSRTARKARVQLPRKRNRFERTAGAPLKGDRRRTPRRQGRHEEVLVYGETVCQAPVRGFVLDRSFNGVSLLVDQAVQEGCELYLYPPQATDTTLCMQMKVKNSRPVANYWRLGCQLKEAFRSGLS